MSDDVFYAARAEAAAVDGPPGADGRAREPARWTGPPARDGAGAEAAAVDGEAAADGAGAEAPGFEDQPPHLINDVPRTNASEAMTAPAGRPRRLTRGRSRYRCCRA